MLRTLLFLPLAVIAGYFVYAGFKYTRMISNIFMSLVYTPPNDVVTNSSMGKRVSILDSRQHEIEGLLVEAPKTDKIVIFCHESGASKESWEKYAYFLPPLGFTVLSADLNGVPSNNEKENSLMQWPTRSTVRRLLTVIRWAKIALNDKADIILFGVSNGADIALAASFEDPSVKAVIADGLFSMKEVFRDYIRKWAPILVKPNLFGEHYPDWVVNIFAGLGFWYSERKSNRNFVDVEKLLIAKHVPLLMIYGEEDDYVPVSHQRFLEKVNRTRNVSYRLVVPKARHNQAVQVGRESYERDIVDFIQKLPAH